MSEKRSDYLSWDEYFMGVAMLSGMRSKDPNTQVGCCIVTLGQLAFLSHWEKLRFYQVSDQIYSSAAAIYLRGKRLLEEEQYCISCIGRALTNGEAEILRRLRGTHDGTRV